MKSPLLLAALAVGLSACGPSEREVGGLVLFALPFIVLIAAGLQLGYRALWHRAVRGEVAPRLDRRPTVWILGISAALWLIPLVGGYTDPEYAVIALWAAGTTYAVYLLIAMRATVHSDRWYARASLVPFLLLAPVALGLVLLGSSTSEAELSAAYFMLPGYAGFVPGGIAALLLLEIALRAHRRKAAERALEPVFPEARARTVFPDPTPDKPERFVARSIR